MNRTVLMAVTPEEIPGYELRNVTKEYGRGGSRVQALRQIDLVIEAGEFVAIVGPSGSGKTTLLQLLGALDRPTSGEIRCQGQNLLQLSDRDLSRLRLRTLGFIFQQFNLIPTLSALANVEAALAPNRLGSGAMKRRAHELLESVGLANRAGHLPSQLSGGEQQRVAIARALANRPSILLADEPTGNLDSVTGDEILDLLHSLSVEHGHTVIVITHDPAVAVRAQHVVRIRDGAVAENIVPASRAERQ